MVEVVGTTIQRDMHDATHLGVGINLETSHTGVERRHLGDVVVLPLTLLLLQLEGDTTDGALLDTLHQVGCETRDLVAQALGGDDGLPSEARVG